MNVAWPEGSVSRTGTADEYVLVVWFWTTEQEYVTALRRLLAALQAYPGTTPVGVMVMGAPWEIKAFRWSAWPLLLCPDGLIELETIFGAGNVTVRRAG